MNTTLTATIVAACLFAAELLGMRLRRYLPEHHLGADTKDSVKLAMGLVATMAALLLGLLVSSAKTSYDTTRGTVIQLATKAALLDRVLAMYGPEAEPVRARFHDAIQAAMWQMWPEERNMPGQLAPDIQAGDAIYLAIHALSPRDDTQRGLKAQSVSLAMDLGQLRTLLVAQSVPSVSKPLLIALVCWLAVIFLGFSLLAPPNATATVALMVSALSVAGAIFLILELDRPFAGLVRIPSDLLLNVLNHSAK